jgi:hypothetical protein
VGKPVALEPPSTAQDAEKNANAASASNNPLRDFMLFGSMYPFRPLRGLTP